MSAREAEDARYHTFLSLSGDGVARFELVPPLVAGADEDAQVEHLLRHARIVECNELFAGLYGRVGREMIGRAMGEFVPRDEPARHAAIREFIRARYRLVYSEEEHDLGGGATRWLSASAFGTVADGRVHEFWLCLREITTRKRTELERERRGRILEAVAFSSARLLQPGDWRERIEEALARLGEAAQAARSWVGERQEGPAGSVGMVFRWAWALPGHEIALDDPRVKGGLLLQQEGIEGLAKELPLGRPVTVVVSRLPAATRAFFDAVGSKSFATVPIIANASLWGVLGFGETRYEREWSALEIDALKAAGAMLGAAIERERADAALRESETRFKELSAAAFEGIAISESGVFVDGNEQLARMLGAPPERLIGRRVSDFVAPEDRERVGSQIGSGAEGPYQHLALRADGSRFPVEVRARSLPWRGRTVRVSALQDVSARLEADERQRKLEAELRQAAEEWRQTFDALDLGIVLADHEGRVVRLNRGALSEAAPRSFAELAGQPIAALAGREPWRALAELHARVELGQPSPVAEARDAASGRAFYLLGSPWPRGEGERPWRVLTFREVTSFTRMQEELRQARAMEALGVLVAGVAHEVRNPLFSISATVDAIEATVAREAGLADHVELLRSQVGRLTQLTRDLLDYGRPSALRRTPSDLGVVVRRAARACAALAEARGVRVEEQVPADLPRLALDATRMEQAVENLLANAIQHAPRGTVVDLVAERAEGEGGPRVRCVVLDRGPGLPRGGASRVFEPFFTRRKGGTGLGLSIVSRIVEGHGGRVSAADREGGGASFAIWLPVEPAPEAAEHA